MLEKTEGTSRKNRQRMRWLMASPTQWNEFEQTPEYGQGQETWHASVHGVTKSQTQLND